MNAQELFLSDGTSTQMWRCEKCNKISENSAEAVLCCKPYEFKQTGELEELNKLTNWIIKEHEKNIASKTEYLNRTFIAYNKDWLCAMGRHFVYWTLGNHNNKWNDKIDKHILDEINNFPSK